MTKKKTTIEDLAVMVQKGFSEVDKRFDEVDKRFGEVDKRFDEIDERFGEVDKRFGGIEGRLMNIESDTSYLKSRVMEIGLTLGRHGEILEEHSEEFKFLHRKIDELTDPRNRKHAITYEEFIKLESRVTVFEKKITARK